jgi:hypothetical protein
MPWNRQVTVDAVIQRLYEGLSLFSKMNRSYDSLIKSSGATSVARPKLAQVVVKKNTAIAANSADRKKTKDDTEMVTTTLDIYTAGILSQMTAEFESNNRLRREYEISMAQALAEQFDKDVIAAAQKTSNILETTASGVLAWKDIAKVSKFFNGKKVPKNGRVLVIPAELEDQFWDIDVIKNAIAYNIATLSSGAFFRILNMDFFISGNVPQVGGKENIVGIYGPGLAFILNRFAEIKEVYSPELQGDVIDLLAHAAAEIDGDEFAVVVKLK